MKRLLGVIATTILTVSSMLVAAAPAQAYKNSDLIFPSGRLNPQPAGCFWLDGSLRSKLSEQGDYCVLSDEIDGTYFRKDSGSLALKIEVRNRSGEMLGKVEFHPYGEWLWVYDTKNDGDTIYVDLLVRPIGSNDWHYKGTVSPPGGDPVVEYSRVNFDIDEGAQVLIQIYDSYRSDLLESNTAVA